MINESADIREMTYDEISDVNGGALDPVTLFVAMTALYATASAYWYNAGKTKAEKDNRQDALNEIENEKYRQGQRGWGTPPK